MSAQQATREGRSFVSFYQIPRQDDDKKKKRQQLLI